MRSFSWITKAAFLCLAYAMYSRLVAGPVASQPAEAGLDTELARLKTALLADPIDTSLAQSLLELRARQERQRQEALDGLTKSMEAFLVGDVSRTGPDMDKAMNSPWVVGMANTVLSPAHLSLRTLLARLDARSSCDRCGGTFLMECPACHGTGLARCPDCHGKGAIRKPGRTARTPQNTSGIVYEPCEKCNHTGATTCESCNGSGTVACTACSKDAGSEPPPVDVVRRAIRRLFATAVHLREGGVDLYSEGALQCSPKLPE